MTYVEFNASNYNGTAGIFQYIQNTVPVFIPGVLILIFFATFLANYYYQLWRSNIANPAASFTAAAFLTTVIATVLSLIPNLISVTYIAVCIGATLVGFLWLWTSSKNG